MTETRPLTTAQIDQMRVKKGVCRHCGGPVPCYSEFGDQRVGVRHSTRTWKAMRRRALTTEPAPQATPSTASDVACSGDAGGGV